MVRRATLDSGPRPDARAQGDMRAHDDLTVPGPAKPPRSAPQWRGAGGRWLVWAARAVLWAVLLVVGYRGVVAIVTGTKQSGTAGPASGAGSPSGFPVQLAEAYALQFGDAYLNFSPATAVQRASQLAPFLAAGAGPQLGWNGAGTQQLQSEQVASVTVHSAQFATVTLLAQVNNQLMELGVPIYAAEGGLVVAGEPALLHAPPRVSPPAQSTIAQDSVTEAALTAQLPAFFRAYASGDEVTLGRFLAPGASISGLSGAVTFGSISGIDVPPGGATRQITISMKWIIVGPPAPPGKTSPVTSAPSQLEMTYAMTVVRQDGSWYVKAIGPSTQQLGPP